MKTNTEITQITRPSKQKHWSAKCKDAVKSERRERADDMKYAA